jgi:hypothetical protein
MSGTSNECTAHEFAFSKLFKIIFTVRIHCADICLQEWSLRLCASSFRRRGRFECQVYGARRIILLLGAIVLSGLLIEHSFVWHSHHWYYFCIVFAHLKDGRTALIWAAQLGLTDCVRVLVAAGADKDVIDNVRGAG